MKERLLPTVHTYTEGTVQYSTVQYNTVQSTDSAFCLLAKEAEFWKPVIDKFVPEWSLEEKDLVPQMHIKRCQCEGQDSANTWHDRGHFYLIDSIGSTD